MNDKISSCRRLQPSTCVYSDRRSVYIQCHTTESNGQLHGCKPQKLILPLHGCTALILVMVRFFEVIGNTY